MANAIKDKSRDFAIRIINCYKYLTEEKKEFIMSNRRTSERRAKLARAIPSEEEEDDSQLMYDV